jgi:hypothetical protein
MSYLKTRTAGYAGAKPEPWMDVTALAADLASALGAALDAPSAEEGPHPWRAGFTMPDGLHVSICWRSYSHSQRVELRADVPAISRKVGARNDARFPEISVDAGRPLAALVKDIRRRLIDASAEARKALEAAGECYNVRRDALAALVAGLRAAHPAIKIGEPDRDHFGVTFNHYGAGVSFTGRLTYEGAIYFDRLNAGDQARAVIASLMAPAAA